MPDNIQRLIRYFLFLIIFCFGIVTHIASGGGGGNDGSNGTTYDISGYIQKGPFISGSSVTIYELDSNLNQTGVSYQTQTIDDFGSFELPERVNSEYVEIISTGFYFDEVHGGLSSGRLTLNTISDVTAGGDIYVNILTCLASYRIRYLVHNENKSFEEARSQAQGELLAIFDITETGIENFDQMNIAEDGNSNAILLAISAILQGDNTVAELSELISKISLDIEEDGTLDNSTYRDEIKNNSFALITGKIRTNLENRYSSLGLIVIIPNFEDYISGKPNLFSSRITLDTGEEPGWVELGDLDGDGDLDLALTNHHVVSVLLNNGDATFAAAVDYYSSTGPKAIGDLDGDGDLDLALVADGNNISVLLNNGDATFATPVTYSGGFNLEFINVGDLDGDSDLDIAVTNGESKTISVYTNNGDGTFDIAVDYSIGRESEVMVALGDLEIGDLDGDGDLDLTVMVSTAGTGTVSVLLNNGDGTFAAAVDYNAGPHIRSTAMGDFDGDGDLDLTDAVSIFLNEGNGTFATPVDYQILGPISVASGDFDGDGDLDLTVTNPNAVSIFLNEGNGTFATALPYDAGYSPCFVDIGDLDGDGDLDLVVTNEFSNSVSLLLNILNN